jgi:hypothetical protein
MIEVFRYSVNGVVHDGLVASPRMATRAFIEASKGEIIKQSGRLVNEDLLVSGCRVVQGFTGEQTSYLRDLISLGAIATSSDHSDRFWLRQLIKSCLVQVENSDGGNFEYSITQLGRVAAAQLL